MGFSYNSYFFAISVIKSIYAIDFSKQRDIYIIYKILEEWQ